MSLLCDCTCLVTSYEQVVSLNKVSIGPLTGLIRQNSLNWSSTGLLIFFDGIWGWFMKYTLTCYSLTTSISLDLGNTVKELFRIPTSYRNQAITTLRQLITWIKQKIVENFTAGTEYLRWHVNMCITADLPTNLIWIKFCLTTHTCVESHDIKKVFAPIWSHN